MATIDRKDPPTDSEVELFLNSVDFKLPPGLIDFYREANGGYIKGKKTGVGLWPLTNLIRLNKGYDVDVYAPDFFIFGSDGGGTAYAIEKETGHIWEIPFIGMSREEAVFKGSTFNEFVHSL